MARYSLSWVQRTTVLHTLPTTEEHWPRPSKIKRNATEQSQVISCALMAHTNGQIPGEKREKRCSGVSSLSISAQLLTGTIFSSGASYHLLDTCPADRGIWRRGHCTHFLTCKISSSSHFQPQCSETQFYVYLCSSGFEFSVGVCRKNSVNDCDTWLDHLALNPCVHPSSWNSLKTNLLLSYMQNRKLQAKVKMNKGKTKIIHIIWLVL